MSKENSPIDDSPKESTDEVVTASSQEGVASSSDSSQTAISPPQVTFSSVGEGDAILLSEGDSSNLENSPSPLETTETVKISPPVRGQEQIPNGTVLGQYEITRFIGGGGMGCVYEARDRGLDRKVAIKVLSSQRTLDENAHARFLNEARSAALLNHKNIAQVYFCGEQDGIVYIAFEYIEGVNVRAWVDEHGPMPLVDAFGFLVQITSALAHAHRHNVTHRDVKPSNILISKDHHVAKLIDMGLARVMRDDPEDDLTATGVTLGTFDYISPEQAKDPRAADCRSDIYSLGCTFYFMLTGQPPFPDGTLLQKLLQHQGDEPPDVRLLIPSIPASIADLIRQMMAKNPAERFDDPSLLYNALLPIGKGLGLVLEEPSSPVSLAETKSLEQRRVPLRSLPWLISLLLFMLIIGGMYWSEWRRGSTVELPPTVFSLSSDPSGNPELPRPTPLPVPEQERLMIRLLGASSISRMGTEAALSGEFPIRSADASTGEFRDCSSGLGAAFQSLAQGISDPALLNAPEAYRNRLRQSISTSAGEVAGTWSLAHFLVSRDDPLPTLSRENPRILLYTVDGKGKDPNTFATLSEALLQIGDGFSDESLRNEFLIELAFDGTMEVDSLKILGRKLKIAAREGLHPQIVFDYGKTSSSDGAKKGSAIFSLTDTDLQLDGVEIGFSAPPTGDWSVFQLSGRSTLHVRNSTMTIQDPLPSSPEKENPYPRVAFTRVVSPEAASSQISEANPALAMETLNPLTGETESSRPVRVDFNRVMIRGEASLASFESLQAGHFVFTNSGFFISGPLISAPNGSMVSASLDRVLGVCLGPLFRGIRSGELPQGNLNLLINQSILQLNHAPLGDFFTETVPEAILSPRWHIADSIIRGASVFLSVHDQDIHRAQKDLPVDDPCFPVISEEDRPAMERILQMPPHLISAIEFSDAFLPSDAGENTPPSEQVILNAIESGYFLLNKTNTETDEQ